MNATIDSVQEWEEQRSQSVSLTNAGMLTFQGITALLFQDLLSESSRRVYRFTFQRWEQFAAENQLELMDLSCENIDRFLFSRELSHSTRISRKSHMQRLLRMVSYLDPSYGIQYIKLRDLNIRRTSRDVAPKRKPRVLSQDECQQLLAVWKNADTHMGIRNYAVICLLIYSAIRNSELVALRWEDVNWDTQSLTICRGNERKRCCLPIFDATPNTLHALRRLQNAQRSVFADHDFPFKHIFPALSTGRQASFKPNKNVRTSTQTIRNIVKQTSEKAGLGKLSSRDIRYTSLTVFSRANDVVAGGASWTDTQFTAARRPRPGLPSLHNQPTPSGNHVRRFNEEENGDSHESYNPEGF